VRPDDTNLCITVNNDQYHSASGRQYVSHQLPASHRNVQESSLNEQSYKTTLRGSAQDKSTHSSHFRETLPALQYRETYKEPLPVPPVKEIVQQTGHLLSQVESWNSISLQPRHDVTTTADQSAVSQSVLVNISNSKYANLDASSSLAQNLLKNISLLGKAFSSSTVTYSPSSSITASCGSTLPSTSTSLFASSTGGGASSTGDRLLLKYRQPQTSSSGGLTSSTATSSTCDPVIASVLKSIGFNFDLSKFGSTAFAKEHEKSDAISQQYGNIASTSLQPVLPAQASDPLQPSQTLTTPLKTGASSAYDKIVVSNTFSEIDEVLKKVREHRKSKARSRSPVKECVRSRSGHMSPSGGREDDISAVRKSSRSTEQKEKKQQYVRRQRPVNRTDKHSSRVLKRGDLPVRRHASPSPWRHDSRAGKASKRKSSKSSSFSPHHRLKSNVRESCHSPVAVLPVNYPAYEYPLPGMVQPLSLSAPVTVPGRWEKKHEDNEWEKSTEEFLRKLQEPSRPSAAPTAHCYSPHLDRDLSSVSSLSSGSVADYLDDSVDDDFSKPFTSPLQPRAQVSAATGELEDTKHGNGVGGDGSKSRDRTVSKMSERRPAVGHRASQTKSSSKVKKVGSIFLSCSSFDRIIVAHGGREGARWAWYVCVCFCLNVNVCHCDTS